MAKATTDAAAWEMPLSDAWMQARLRGRGAAVMADEISLFDVPVEVTAQEHGIVLLADGRRAVVIERGVEPSPREAYLSGLLATWHAIDRGGPDTRPDANDRDRGAAAARAAMLVFGPRPAR